MHWAAQYIGRQLGPNKCWEFVRLIERQHFAREAPAFELVNPRDVATVALKMEHERTKPCWTRLLTPLDGCIVAMGHGRVVHHVGVFLNADGGVVLHAMDKKGILCDGLHTLGAKHGINLVQFFLHSSWATS